MAVPKKYTVPGVFTLLWYGDPVKKALDEQMVKRVSAAAELVRSVAVRSISDPYPPASSPGEPPHARSGHLRNSVFWALIPGQHNAMIGTNVHYGLSLELGSSRMAARPWLVPAVAQARPGIDKIMQKPLGGGGLKKA